MKNNRRLKRNSRGAENTGRENPVHLDGRSSVYSFFLAIKYI